MTQQNQPIVIDYSNDFLPGSPIAVTVILSDATWDSLTKYVDDIRLFGGLDILPLHLRIERFIEDQTAKRCYAIDSSDYMGDGSIDLTDEVPF